VPQQFCCADISGFVCNFSYLNARYVSIAGSDPFIGLNTNVVKGDLFGTLHGNDLHPWTITTSPLRTCQQQTWATTTESMKRNQLGKTVNTFSSSSERLNVYSLCFALVTVGTNN